MMEFIHVLSHHPLWLDSAPLHRPQCRLIVVYRCTCELSASIIILLSHPPHIQRDRYTTVPFDATSNHAQILIRWQTHLSVYLMEITCRRPSSSLSAQFNGNGNSVNGLRWYRTSFLPTSSQSYYGPPATHSPPPRAGPAPPPHNMFIEMDGVEWSEAAPSRLFLLKDTISESLVFLLCWTFRLDTRGMRGQTVFHGTEEDVKVNLKFIIGTHEWQMNSAKDVAD